MTIAFQELDGSPREVFSPEGIVAERRLVVAWEDRHALVAQLLGEHYALGLPPPGGYPGRSGVLAVEVRVEPWPAEAEARAAMSDPTVELNSYSGRWALVTVDYAMPDRDPGRGDLPSVSAHTYLTYRMELAGQTIRVPGETLRWETDGAIPVPVEAIPPLRVPIVEHQITWHRAPLPPWSAIRNAAGCVNAQPFLGAPPETILFDGAIARRQFIGIDAEGTAAFGWRLTYVFRERAIKTPGGIAGWNHAFRSLPASSPGWDRLTTLDGRPFYAAVNFAGLFAAE